MKKGTSLSGLGETEPSSGTKVGELQLPPTERESGSGSGGGDGGKNGLSTGERPTMTSSFMSAATAPLGFLKKIARSVTSSDPPARQQLGGSTQPPVPTFSSSTVQLSVPKEFQFGDSTPHQPASEGFKFSSSKQPPPVPSTAPPAQTMSQPPGLSLAAAKTSIVSIIPDKPVFTLVDVHCRAML